MTSGTPARAEDDVDEEPVETEVPVAVPAPSFANFGVSKAVVDALSMRNIDGTFEIQALVLADAIAGRDVLAKSRTGSGKTLAFAVPIVERLEHDQKSPTALILVPTRELATQVADEFRGIIDPKGMKVATVYGGVGLQDQGKRAAKADVDRRRSTQPLSQPTDEAFIAAGWATTRSVAGCTNSKVGA